MVYIMSAPGRDAATAEKLRVVLQPAANAGLIRLTVNGNVNPGETVNVAQGRKMLEASIVVALLSPDFLASKQELMSPGMGSRAMLVPVRIRSCLLIDPVLTACAILPTDGSVADNAGAIVSVAADVLNAVERLGPGRKPEPPSTTDLFETICDLGLFNNRRALLAGIPAAIVAGIPDDANNPAGKILSDINELQRMPEHWRAWLNNACALTRMRPESLVFHRALMAL